MIYKDGDLIVSIPAETKGRGSATISRRFQFDPGSLYEAEVILNYGTGVEIKGNRIKLPVAKVQVRNNEYLSPVDEIKFGDGSKDPKIYRIELKSRALKYLCTSLTGKIAILDKNSQPITVPPASGDETYGADYQLRFKSPLLLGDCDVEVIDTLDSGSTKASSSWRTGPERP